MLIQRYKIIVMDSALQKHLAESGKPASWTIAANSMQSAWGKFCTQHFGALKPAPSDYDISLERF